MLRNTIESRGTRVKFSRWVPAVSVFARFLLVAGLMSACAPQVLPLIRADEQAPANFPEQYYRQAIERGRPVFRVDPDRSLVVVEVRKGGSLARLGHDHVVASHDVIGYVEPGGGRADLFVRLDRLVVDEPELRAEAGFDTRPSAADIAGTRQNMLAKVLEVERHPYALVSVTVVGADEHGPSLNVAITLHGITRVMKISAKIPPAADAFDANGQLSLDQSDFGIVPLSVLGGAIQVLDNVSLRFRIHASRIALSP